MEWILSTGADPARRKTDRRQKRKITGSCDDGTHHQRKQKGIQFTPQEMSLILDILKEGRPAKETGADWPDGADGPHTYEESYITK